jgi:vancomycin resistance protein YoaR
VSSEASTVPIETPAPTGQPGGRPMRTWLVTGGTVIALLVTAGGVAVWAMAGDVPRGTEVLGLDLGGKSRAAAAATLHRRFDPRAAEPAAIALDGRSVTIDPADIAMTLDVDATVDRAAQGGMRLSGTWTVPPVIRLDEAKLDAVLRRQIDGKRITRVAPAITYRGVTPHPTYPKAGLDLDVVAAAGTVRKVWLTGRTGTVALAELPPATTDAEVDALAGGLARTAVADPVTVRADGKQFTLSPAAIAKALQFRADRTGRLVPAIDGDRLHVAAASDFATVETAPEEASISLQGGKPVIVASTAGRVVDLTRLAADLLTVLATPAPRAVIATLVTKDSDTTDADLARLGVKERVSTFTTYFTGGAKSPRTQNIVTIAKAVDGAIVKPDETFSLNGHTGERNYDAGYQDAPVIVGGKLEPGVGGGASQFTTTLFNAAYYAGLQDVEHKPHSFYFSRYPAVIESTIFYPTLDLKFKNTTPYGVLIDTSTTGNSVTVSMWSTKYYDSVTTERSARRNVTGPPTVYREPGPKCISSSGLPGFAQDAWRIIRKDGKQIKREKFTWRYDPEPRFVCGAQPE